MKTPVLGVGNQRHTGAGSFLQRRRKTAPLQAVASSPSSLPGLDDTAVGSGTAASATPRARSALLAGFLVPIHTVGGLVWLLCQPPHAQKGFPCS